MDNIKEDVFINGVQATFQDRVTSIKKELEYANIYRVEEFSSTLIELSRLFDDLNMLFEMVEKYKHKSEISNGFD